MPFLFNQTRALVVQIDDFLDVVSEAVLIFQRGATEYIRGRIEEFEAHYEAVDAAERSADELKRGIERQLYRHSLIPESRGDVLGMLETMDDVTNHAKHTLGMFLVERPELLPGMESDWLALIDAAHDTAEAVILAARAFFRDPRTVNDHLHKVYFHEKEGDRLAMALKRKIFASDADLARKTHLRYFAMNVDRVADTAQAVADRLSISAIKRTV